MGDILGIIADGCSILTAAVAVWLFAHVKCQSRKRRIKVEKYLEESRQTAEGAEKGQRSILNIMARVGLTEQEVLQASFDSKHIRRLLKSDTDGYPHHFNNIALGAKSDFDGSRYGHWNGAEYSEILQRLGETYGQEIEKIKTVPDDATLTYLCKIQAVARAILHLHGRIEKEKFRPLIAYREYTDDLELILISAVSALEQKKLDVSAFYSSHKDEILSAVQSHIRKDAIA